MDLEMEVLGDTAVLLLLGKPHYPSTMVGAFYNALWGVSPLETAPETWREQKAR